MSVTGFAMGHRVEFINGQWVYSDTKEVASQKCERACTYCSNFETKEGHDPCLGTLPGVQNACCGHGNTEQAYIQFENGEIYRGLIAIKIMKNKPKHSERTPNDT